MERMYWQLGNGGIEAWIDIEDGKTWYRFADHAALYTWAKRHRYYLVAL